MLATISGTDWLTFALACVVGAVAVGALVAQAVQLRRQTREQQLQTGELRRQSFITAMERAQSSEQRACRQTALRLARKAALRRDEEEELANAIDAAAAGFQEVAVFVDEGWIDRDLVLRHWRYAIRDVWALAEPHIRERRTREGNCELYRELERLADHAVGQTGPSVLAAKLSD